MGKYARTTGSGSRFVELDQDIARRFQDTREVNETLRIVLKLRELGHGKRRKSA
ncbi:MAG: hypothetical protein ACREJC_23375 [Tepidisphaeraceae bacterium]